jgi:hypothetical protein
VAITYTDKVNKGLRVETIAKDGNCKNFNRLFTSSLPIGYTNFQEKVLLKSHILEHLSYYRLLTKESWTINSWYSCADNVSYFFRSRFQWSRGRRRGLRPVACCRVCGFESRRGRGCLSVVNVVFCQVQKSLCRAEYSPRGVGHRCVWATNLKNVEAIVCIWPQRTKTKRFQGSCQYLGLFAKSYRTVSKELLGNEVEVSACGIIFRYYNANCLEVLKNTTMILSHMVTFLNFCSNHNTQSSFQDRTNSVPWSGTVSNPITSHIY